MRHGSTQQDRPSTLPSKPMNSGTLFASCVVCGLLASTAVGADAKSPKPATAPAPAQPPAALNASSPVTQPLTAPQTPRTKEKPTAAQGSTVKPGTELAAQQALEEANEEHIKPVRGVLKVETPPPAAREEKKPPSPGAGLVWVPGHWVPVKGEWQWRPGEWGFPATPISVWIEAKYDDKSKQWTAGYWQPDRAAPHEREKSSEELPPSTEKFF
jgi:hypothetical protein